MFHSRAQIQVGDVVILYMSRDNMTAITVTPGQVFHNKYGRYTHDSLIGHKFGSKMHSPPPQSGYIHLLRPTPELWTLSLPHRTQILYLPDISYITMKLAVRVGGTVMEAGTGSGSMTHSLSRSVGPNGRVYSFEYHRSRYEKALEEFEGHDLKNVTLQHQNVCKDGFPNATGVEGVFLDLPAPWEAIPHVVKTLRPDIITRICCFSPCLEQVLKTVSTLRTEGYTDISTQEVLIRTHELAPPPPPGSGHLDTISSIVDRLKNHEKRKSERRILQMRTAREKARKVKGIEEESMDVAGEESTAAVGSKRKLPEDVTALPETATTEQNPDKDLEGQEPTAEVEDNESTWSEPITQIQSAVLTKPTAEMKGHTSYLTFATLYPISVRTALDAQDPVAPTPASAPTARVAELVGESESVRETDRAGSQETDYGNDGIEQIMGSLTEEQFIALAGQ